MTAATASTTYQKAIPGVYERVVGGAFWLMLAFSFVVMFEPAPSDLAFVLVLMFFVQARLYASIGVMPLLMLLLVYNIGGFVSYFFAAEQPKALMFVVTSVYMAVMAIVVALFVAGNPERRFNVIAAGWMVAAPIAAIWGLIDFFNLPSPIPLQVLPGRATGLFKDPNVFSTFLIFPIIVKMQALMHGTARRPILMSLSLALCVLALFLSFSRGAWINMVMSTVLLVAITFVISPEQRIRTRMILFIIGGFIFAALAFMVLMSIPAIQKMFIERFALVQYYDAGETGRFGNQLRSLPELVRLPFGYGPFVFRTVYGQDPHNTFINAFSAYGWIGGVSYVLLVISTLFVGAKSVFSKTPWQRHSIAVFCPMLAVILQGIQIDTDHWRHFYWMLGLLWGLAAATQQAALFNPPKPVLAPRPSR